MNTNGNVSPQNLLQPLPPPWLQIAIDALNGIALQATTASNKLEGGLIGAAPLSLAAPTPAPAPAAGDASESAEINALLKVIPDAAAAQLKAWNLQKDLVTAAYPGLAAPSVFAAPTPTNRITVHAYWWGFHLVVPEPVMTQWTAGGATVGGVIAAIAGATGPAAPFIAAAAAYVAAEFGLMKTVDKGRGVYVSMSWFAPGIFVPTSI
jgi:hypothetical protein